MKRLIIYQVILIFSFQLYAQDVSVKVQYPPVVTTGQQFNVTWTVNSGGGEFAAPPFSPFYKLMGPQTSYSSSTQIINGRMSTSTTYTYIYYLQAISEGKFIIPPAVFTLKNKNYVSDSLFIEVISNSASQASAAPAAAGTNPQETQQSGKDIYVNLILSRKEIYLGEPIVATVKLYTKVNITGINEIKYPAFNGFLKSDLNTPPLTSLSQENINGTIYGTGVVQQFLLYPQVTGEISIDPVQLTVLIQQRSGQSDPFFGDFFSTYQTIPRMVVSPVMKIKVNPLPGNQPPDYSGIVGKLYLKASINKDTVNVNDALNLKIAISGTGNLKVAAAPSLRLSPDIEVYDPKTTDDIKNGINGTSGTKTFEFLLIPRHYGNFTIPSVSYSYFNTARGKFEQLSTPEFKFYARKGDEQSSDITVYGGVSKTDVGYLGKDIRFIKSDPGNLNRSESLLIATRSYFSVFAFSILTFLAILFIRREHVRRNADISRVRNRKAGKIAVKRLRNASACLKNSQLDMFYEEILKSIWGYLSDKLGIPVADMTRSRISESLSERSIDEETISGLNQILDKCEYARFAPTSSGTEAASIYDGASQFIKSVENSIVKKMNFILRKISLLIFMMLFANYSTAQETAPEKFEQGVKYYSSGSYKEAVQIWTDIYDTGYRSASLNYNIANAYFKLEDIPQAILFYERAYMLDPVNEDINYNLQIARTLIVDRFQEIPELFFVRWYNLVSLLLSSNVWAIAGISAFVLCLLFLSLYIFSSRYIYKVTGFWLALLFLIVSGSSVLLSQRNKSQVFDSHKAIIFSPVISGKSSPDDSGTDLFVLHEGTKVSIEDEVGEWYEIRLSDGNKGWIPSNGLKII